MRILGVETSCDETGAAVIEGSFGDKNVRILSNVIVSSLSLHKKTGGIVPETAAREQIKYIIPVIEQALIESGCLERKIVNHKPALPAGRSSIINPVNHLIGHIYANFVGEIHNSEFIIHNSAAGIQFPAIALVVSGGHTDLVLIKNHRNI